MIHNACHFQFKVGFCVFGGIAKFRVSVAHTLMRRYAPKIGFTSMLLWRIRIISIF